MTTYYSIVTGSRIVSADRTTDHSGSDDTAVTNWVIGTDFVLCVHQSDNSKDAVAGTYKLQWRNVTDSGSFTDLAAAGELNYSVGGATDLTNGTACAPADWKCSDVGYTDVDGTEREDSNATVAFDGRDEDETEHQWAINTDDALAGKTYAFQLVDTANGNRTDAIGVTLTTAAASINITPDDGVHSEAAGAANVTLQAHAIAPDAGIHGHVAGQAGVNVKWAIAPDTATHLTAAGGASVNVKWAIVPNGATHTHTADQAEVSTSANLVVTPTNGVHAHAAGQALLNVKYAISPDNGVHGETAAEASMVLQPHSITPENGVHSHVAGQADVSVKWAITPASGVHAHAAGQASASVITVWPITPDGAVHNLSADEALVNVIWGITPNNGVHVHTAQEAATNTNYAITPDSSLHLTSAGEARIFWVWDIAPNDGVHGEEDSGAIFMNISTGNLVLKSGGIIINI